MKPKTSINLVFSILVLVLATLACTWGTSRNSNDSKNGSNSGNSNNSSNSSNSDNQGQTTTHQNAADLLIGRHPSQWLPDKTTFEFEKYDFVYEENSKSNKDKAAGDAQRLEALNRAGLITEFGYKWHSQRYAEDCFGSGVAVKAVALNSIYVVVDMFKDSNSAKAFLDERIQQTEKADFVVSTESITDTSLGENNFVTIRYSPPSCNSYYVYFRRNNILGIVVIYSFDNPQTTKFKEMPAEVRKLALQAALILDNAIIDEAQNHPGNIADLETMFLSATQKDKTTVNNDNSQPSDDPQKYLEGSVSCYAGGPNTYQANGNLKNTSTHAINITISWGVSSNYPDAGSAYTYSHHSELVRIEPGEDKLIFLAGANLVTDIHDNTIRECEIYSSNVEWADQ